MRFRLRLLARNATAYVLFTLFPLAAYSQEASTQETHGIVVANMDRSVKPGDDFYHYANGDWIKRTEIPPDSGYVAVGGWSNGCQEEKGNQMSKGRGRSEQFHK
jgi:hypothetical protein